MITNHKITKFKIIILILINYVKNLMTTIPKSPILTPIYNLNIIQINTSKTITIYHKINNTNNNFILTQLTLTLTLTIYPNLSLNTNILMTKT